MSADTPSLRWLDEREQQAWRAFQFMHMRLSAALARDLTEHCDGLSMPDYGVLVALTDQPDGRLRAFELAEELGWEQSRLSHHLSRMATRGLVTKTKCASDRRGSHITITAAGRDAIAQAAPGHVAAVRRLFVDVLSPDELDAVARAATKVLAHLSD